MCIRDRYTVFYNFPAASDIKLNHTIVSKDLFRKQLFLSFLKAIFCKSYNRYCQKLPSGGLGRFEEYKNIPRFDGKAKPRRKQIIK